MKVENGKLILEKTDCHWCDQGKRPGKKPCPTCNGTGRGKRGKIKGCKDCFGNRTQPDFVNTVPCEHCNGNWQNSQDETITDYMPQPIWQGMTFKVYRQNTGMTWNESWMALGMVFSCTDYGSAWNATDAAVIEKVKSSTGHQASKVAKDDGTLADHIAIVVKPQGYAVRAVFNINPDSENVPNEPSPIQEGSHLPPDKDFDELVNNN